MQISGECSIQTYLLDNLNWLLPLATTLIFSLLNIVVAFCNFSLSKNQKKMQNDAFCFQLYENRLLVYENVKKILATIIQNGNATKEELRQLLVETRQSEFLFGDDVISIFKSLYKTINELRIIQLKMEQATGSEHSMLCSKETELLDKICEYNLILSEIICNYISFSNYRIKNEKHKNIMKKFRLRK